MFRSILKLYGRTAAMPTAYELISQITTKFVSNYNNSKIWIKQMHGWVRNSKFYIPNQGSAWPVPIKILKSWVPLGTRYRGNLKKLGTPGYRVPARKIFFGYRWAPGTGQKIFFGYRWVLGTGQIFNDADPWSQFYWKIWNVATCYKKYFELLMLWTDNVANCYAKKLRAAKNESIWLAKKWAFCSIILNATILLAEKCCELLCEQFIL